MAFIPSQTTGLGVAAKIAVQGNQGTSIVPGKNNVVLSVGGTNGATTFQMNPLLQDVAGNSITPGTALTLTSVASSSPGPLTLSAVAAASNGVAVYTGTITGGGSNALVGQLFTVAGFTNAVNNGAFVATASTTTTLTLQNVNAVAETHAGTATSEIGTAVYTGTITGGGSNALAGQTFVIAGFTTASNNGTFIATASSTTTLTLENNAAASETHAATATSEESGNSLTYLAMPAKTLTGNTYQPSGTSSAVATVSSTGLITAVKPGGVEIEVSYPTFNNSEGTAGTTFGGSVPKDKIYATVNVTVLP